MILYGEIAVVLLLLLPWVRPSLWKKSVLHSLYRTQTLITAIQLPGSSTAGSCSASKDSAPSIRTQLLPSYSCSSLVNTIAMLHVDGNTKPRRVPLQMPSVKFASTATSNTTSSPAPIGPIRTPSCTCDSSEPSATYTSPVSPSFLRCEFHSPPPPPALDPKHKLQGNQPHSWSIGPSCSPRGCS